MPVCAPPGGLTPAADGLQRIRHRAQFDAVLASAPAVKTMHFALHLVDLSASPGPDGSFAGGRRWIGALVPKRWARRAVTRNLLRRQIYEVAREMARAHGPAWPQAAMVVRLRSAFSRQQYPSAASDALRRATRQELQRLFQGVCRGA